MVCNLKNRLFGLKQAPRQWYLKFDRFMASNGYMMLQADHCCYFKYFENSYIVLLLYVVCKHEEDCKSPNSVSNERLGYREEDSWKDQQSEEEDC